MKHKNKFFLQLSRQLFTEKYEMLSVNAKWLFVVLNELEQRFCSDNQTFFFRSNEELAKDCGFSLSTLKRAKSELANTDLIETWQAHFKGSKDSISEKHLTCYRIIK